MNIPEAIEKLQTERELNEIGGLSLEAKANQLGIEALERINELRVRNTMLVVDQKDVEKLLPSEEEK